MPTALLKAGGLGLKRVGFRGDCLLQPLCFEHALLLPRKPLCFRLLHKGSRGCKTGPVRDTGLEELVAAGYQLLIGMGGRLGRWANLFVASAPPHQRFR